MSVSVVKLKNLLYRGLDKLGRGFRTRLIRAYLLVKDFDGREHTVRYGEKNPDKTIYLIRRKPGTGEGLLSVFTYIMGRIDFADRNGYIPYVDIDGSTGELFGRYFRQKTAIKREEVYQSRNVLLSGWDSKPVYPGWCNWINTEYNIEKKALFEKYITFTDEILNAAKQAAEEIKPERCLGLYLRGTDYTSLKPVGHPIQPTLQDVKREIDGIMSRRKLQRIFLVTEDQLIYQQVSDAYPGQVAVVRDDRFWKEHDSNELIWQTIERYGNVEDNNILYLVKIILLSQCRVFVGGRTNGSVVANALNGGNYEERFVYDVGLYS